MGWLRRDKPETVSAELVAAGAPSDVADGIVRALLEAGLSTGEARDWLGHPNLAYPHDWPMEWGDEVITMKAGSLWMVEKGEAETVLAAAPSSPPRAKTNAR